MRCVALNKSLTTLGFVPVMIWYAAVVSLAIGATAVIAEDVLTLLKWGSVVSGSVLWFLSCVALVTLLFRLYVNWRTDRVQTSLRFFRTPLLWLSLAWFASVFASVILSNKQGMSGLGITITVVGLFIAMDFRGSRCSV